MTTKERQQTSWSTKCKERYPHISGYDDSSMGGFWYPSRPDNGAKYIPNYRSTPRC